MCVYNLKLDLYNYPSACRCLSTERYQDIRRHSAVYSIKPVFFHVTPAIHDSVLLLLNSWCISKSWMRSRDICRNSKCLRQMSLTHHCGGELVEWPSERDLCIGWSSSNLTTTEVHTRPYNPNSPNQENLPCPKKGGTSATLFNFSFRYIYLASIRPPWFIFMNIFGQHHWVARGLLILKQAENFERKKLVEKIKFLSAFLTRKKNKIVSYPRPSLC